MIKRFIIFAGNNYYPQGGWADFLSMHDDEASALDAAEAWRNSHGAKSNEHSDAWLQIVDTETQPDPTATAWSNHRRVNHVPQWEVVKE